MLPILLSSTARKLLFMMVDSTDHLSGKTGLTVTVTLSKNGAAFASPAGTVAEVGSGWYALTPTSADTGTLGELLLHATATGADVSDTIYVVAAYDPYSATNLGLSALPTATAGANGGLPLGDASGRVDIGKALGTAVTLDTNNVLNVSTKYLAGTALTGRDIGLSVLLSSGTGTGQLDFTAGVTKANTTQWLGGTIPAVNVTGVPLVDTKYIGGTLQTARDIGLSVLVAIGTATGQLDVTAGVIKANLAQILGTVLTETSGLIAAGFKQFFNVATPTGTLNVIPRVTLTDTLTTYTGNTPQTGDVYPLVDTEIAAIKAKTDLIPGSPAAVGSAMTLAADSVNASALATDAVDEIVAGLAALVVDGTITLKQCLAIQLAIGVGDYAAPAVASHSKTVTYKRDDSATTIAAATVTYNPADDTTITGRTTVLSNLP